MKFHPIIAIITGLFVTYICIGFLALITGIVTSIDISARIPFGITNVVIGITSFLIGGFVSTFLASKKKIKYGIYIWIIFMIINILGELYFKIRGLHPNQNYLIIIGTSIGYLLTVTIGSYLGKAADEHLKPAPDPNK